MSDQPSKSLSFSFSKTKQTDSTALSAPRVVLDTEANHSTQEDKNYVLSIDNEGIKSSKPIEKKTPLVIPLIETNNWRNQRLKKDTNPVSEEKTVETKSDNKISEKLDGDKSQEAVQSLSIDDLARKELLEEAADSSGVKSKESSSRVIPIFVANRVPEGFEEDGNFNVLNRAENPTLDDYERVPVTEFGMALLRGMGFKEEEAKTSAPVEPKIRPKGLGLGAELPQTAGSKTSSSTSSSKESLELKVKAHVYVMTGKQKGLYGTIEAFDDDMIQADVHLVLPNITASIPVAFLSVVSRDEFKKESKVLNKTSYDQYKEKDKPKEESRDRHHERRHRKESGSKHEESHDNGYSSQKRDKHHSSSRHSSSRDSDRHRHDRKHKTEREGSGHRRETRRESYEDHYPDERRRDDRDDPHGRRRVSPVVSPPPSSSDPKEFWLFPGLRVRIIDKNYKNGRFYKEKVEIIDVTRPGVCSAMTIDRKRVEELSQRSLETVIPKEEGSTVMIVQGEHKGKVGTILQRDKHKEIAFVQMTIDKEVLKLSFDEICEFSPQEQYD